MKPLALPGAAAAGESVAGRSAVALSRLASEGAAVPPAVVIPAGPREAGASSESAAAAAVSSILAAATPARLATRLLPRCLLVLSRSAGQAGAAAAAELPIRVRVPHERAAEEAASLAAAFAEESGAVLVLREPRAEAAGIAFSRDPESAAGSAVLVGAARGSAAEVLGGSAPLDVYRFDLLGGSFLLLDLHRGAPGRLASLREPEARTVAEAARRAEALLGQPAQITWCIEGSGLWILDARPLGAGASSFLRGVTAEIPAPPPPAPRSVPPRDPAPEASAGTAVAEAPPPLSAAAPAAVKKPPRDEAPAKRSPEPPAGLLPPPSRAAESRPAALAPAAAKEEPPEPESRTPPARARTAASPAPPERASTAPAPAVPPLAPEPRPATSTEAPPRTAEPSARPMPPAARKVASTEPAPASKSAPAAVPERPAAPPAPPAAEKSGGAATVARPGPAATAPLPKSPPPPPPPSRARAADTAERVETPPRRAPAVLPEKRPRPALDALPPDLWAHFSLWDSFPAELSPLSCSLFEDAALPPALAPLVRRAHGPLVLRSGGELARNLDLLADALESIGVSAGALSRIHGAPIGSPPAEVPSRGRAGGLLRAWTASLFALRDSEEHVRAVVHALRDSAARPAGEPPAPADLERRRDLACAALGASMELLAASAGWADEFLRAARGAPGASLEAAVASPLPAGRALPAAVAEMGRTLQFEPEASARLAAALQSARTAADAAEAAAGALHGTRAGKELRRLLEDFGHRGASEPDTRGPRVAECAGELAWAALAASRRTELPYPEESAERLERAAEGSLAAVAGVSRRRGTAAREAAARLRALLLLREELHDALAASTARDRESDVRLATAWAGARTISSPDDYFHLRWDEIAGALRSKSLSPEVARRSAERRAGWPSGANEEMAWIRGGTAGRASGENAAKVVSARGLSPGRAGGPAFGARDPVDCRNLPPGSVLVVQLGHAGFLPFFAVAGGLVIEECSHYSPAAVAARACGIPCVAGAPGAVSRALAGGTVEIDGETGGIAWEESQ